MEQDPTKCINCGKDLPASTVGRSTRCMDCLALYNAERALDDYAEMDADILDRVEVRKQKVKDIAVELDLTTAAVYARIKTARAREAVRAERR